jgi:hypothetical protein
VPPFLGENLTSGVSPTFQKWRKDVCGGALLVDCKRKTSFYDFSVSLHVIDGYSLLSEAQYLNIIERIIFREQVVVVSFFFFFSVALGRTVSCDCGEGGFFFVSDVGDRPDGILNRNWTKVNLRRYSTVVALLFFFRYSKIQNLVKVEQKKVVFGRGR